MRYLQCADIIQTFYVLIYVDLIDIICQRLLISKSNMVRLVVLNHNSDQTI